MKLFKILALVCLCSIGVVACAPSQPIVANQVTGGGFADKTVIDEKALAVAELTYNTAANAYIELSLSGVLTGDDKEKAKNAMVESYSALLIARKAYTIGDADTFELKTKAVLEFANQANEIFNEAQTNGTKNRNSN